MADLLFFGSVFVANNLNKKNQIDRTLPEQLSEKLSDHSVLYTIEALDGDEIPLKSDIPTMEHPFFALKAGNKEIFKYQNGEKSIKVTPSVLGHATQDDKKLWWYFISQLKALKEKGVSLKPSPMLEFRPYDFFKIIGRTPTGQAYQRIRNSLKRLAGTFIETNIETDTFRRTGIFHLIEKASLEEIKSIKASDRSSIAYIQMPDWIIDLIESNKILTISRDALSLSSFQSRIYEIARKHCGKQNQWKINIEKLQLKTGSSVEAKQFKFQLKKIIKLDICPEYHISLDEKNNMVIFSLRPSSKSVDEDTQETSI